MTQLLNPNILELVLCNEDQAQLYIYMDVYVSHWGLFLVVHQLFWAWKDKKGFQEAELGLRTFHSGV